MFRVSGLDFDTDTHGYKCLLARYFINDPITKPRISFRQLMTSLVINGGLAPSPRENIVSFFGDRETYHILITSHTQLTERA